MDGTAEVWHYITHRSNEVDYGEYHQRYFELQQLPNFALERSLSYLLQCQTQENEEEPKGHAE